MVELSRNALGLTTFALGSIVCLLSSIRAMRELERTDGPAGAWFVPLYLIAGPLIVAGGNAGFPTGDGLSLYVEALGRNGLMSVGTYSFCIGLVCHSALRHSGRMLDTRLEAGGSLLALVLAALAVALHLWMPGDRECLLILLRVCSVGLPLAGLAMWFWVGPLALRKSEERRARLGRASSAEGTHPPRRP